MRINPFIVVLNLLVLLKLKVNAYPVPMTLVANAAAKGAVCLDGSPPAYHFSPGFGSGANNWLVHMEGGGWCSSIEECLERQNNFRGSSTKMKPLSFSGILGNKQSSNPDFYNWNKVKVRYCDGSSFTGDVESVVQQRNFILEDLEFGLLLWKSYWLREFKMHKMLCFLGVQLVDWHLYFIVIRSVIFYQPVQKLNAFRMLDFSSMRRMFLEQITSMNSFLLL